MKIRYLYELSIISSCVFITSLPSGMELAVLISGISLCCCLRKVMQSQLESFPATPEYIPTPSWKRLLRSLEENGARCGMWEGSSLLTPLCCRTAVLSAAAANSLQLQCTRLSGDPSALCRGKQLPAGICSTVWLYFKKMSTLCCSWATVSPHEAKSYLCRLNPLLVSMFSTLTPSSDHCV